MEKKTKYLYGAAVQGIQGFIFQTNKLREIVGASELVEEICTDMFVDLFPKVGVKYEDENCILHVAGNIKYIFDNEDECNKRSYVSFLKWLPNLPRVSRQVRLW